MRINWVTDLIFEDIWRPIIWACPDNCFGLGLPRPSELIAYSCRDSNPRWSPDTLRHLKRIRLRLGIVRSVRRRFLAFEVAS